MQRVGKRICAECGALVLESTPCPVCLLRGALSRDAFASGSTVETSYCRSSLYFEHYQVLRNEDGRPIELGRGSMGVTYKAVDINLRYVVALKVIKAGILGDQSACQRFVREARAAASISHANVASVFHLGKQGHSYFYAMEFVDGETLDKIIRRAGPLETPAALRVLTLVASGLEALAKQNLVHRDIKPSNIIICLEGARIVDVKIIDLGLAKSVVEDEIVSAISNPGSFAGTPRYASPEQFAGTGADIRSDLYSLGITFWELLSGELPFRGSTSELSYQHQHVLPPLESLRRIPRPITALLARLLKKDPAQRFQSPTELLKAIKRVTERPDSERFAAGELRPSAEDIVVRPDNSTRHLARAWFGPKTVATGKLFGCGAGVVSLLLACLLLSGHPSFFDQRGKPPAEKSIAVLPFESISGNKEDTYFADGVHDEILVNLAGIAQLEVVSRTSVMQYRGGSRCDLRRVAAALGVTTVLEGTVRRDGNRVRVCAQLIDARNDKLIWADSYDRDLNDTFATQSEIARQITARLAGQLQR